MKTNNEKRDYFAIKSKINRLDRKRYESSSHSSLHSELKDDFQNIQENAANTFGATCFFRKKYVL